MATAVTTQQRRAAELTVIARQQRSLWRDALHRLLRNRAAIVGMVVIAFFAFVAIFASVLAPYDPNGLNGGVKNQLLEPIWTKPFGGQYTNPAFLLGTDELSRDILSRLMYRARGRELGRPRAAHPGPGHVAQAPRVHRGGALHRRPTDSDHAEASLPERPRAGDRLARLRDPGRDAHRSDVVLSRHRRAAAHLHLGLRDQRGLRRLLDDSVAGAAAGALHLGHLAVLHLCRQRAAGRARPAVQDRSEE